MTRVETWVAASRLRTLGAAIGPVLMGWALASEAGGFHWPSALCALFGALAIQIGTNLANDYFDFQKGADTEDRVGPVRATAAGLVRPQVMLGAFVGMFAVATLLGIYLVWRGGWPIVIVGLLSILFGVLYTGGPRPLGYLGLGDLFVLVFFGPVAVAGTVYVQSLELSWPALIAGIAPGLLSTAILTVNNLRDRHTDARAGKKTLTVRFGSRFARIEYAVCLLGAAIIPPLLWWMQPDRWGVWLACGFVIPAVALVRRLWHADGPSLNPLLGGTNKLLLVFSLLFSGGWLLP
jgi:1,4-dihydroxy-2-naphthoate octaprenyltransferase